MAQACGESPRGPSFWSRLWAWLTIGLVEVAQYGPILWLIP